jgi:hypothetical protein
MMKEEGTVKLQIRKFQAPEKHQSPTFKRTWGGPVLILLYLLALARAREVLETSHGRVAQPEIR